MVTVKADPRVANIVHEVNKYAEKFLDMDDNMLDVVVTYMDNAIRTMESCVKDLEASPMLSSQALKNQVPFCKATFLKWNHNTICHGW